jgi:hypothetical protein
VTESATRSRLNPSGEPVCEKCIEIDRAVARYRQIKRSISDQLTVDRAQDIIAELEAEKAQLHPEQIK